MANLANTYRPQTWEDVTEQAVTIEMVKSICEQPVITNRNFLFIGSAGTGKTTTARLMAKYINHGAGEVIEIDAASHNGVDSVREIVQQARSYPVGCSYKVFVIDECHTFSPQSWQMLLAPLESMPAKSIFIFCTTNPEKIPATILSRVQTFRLSKISLQGIQTRLKTVLDSEIAKGRELTYEPEAINFIAKLANGGMRDALTLLDKALAYSPNVTLKGLSQALNLPSYDDYFALLNSCARKDNQAIARMIDTVYNSGVNFVKWFEGFHSFVINIVKYIYLRDINATMIPGYYQEKIQAYDVKHVTVCLKLANKLMKLIQDLKLTQYLQETALTYLCTIPSGK